MPVKVEDNGVMEALGALDGFTGAVMTDKHIGAWLAGLHGHLSRMFDDQMDVIAAGAPKMFGHMYESNRNFGPGARLWTNTLSGRGRTRVASIDFKASRVPVPVDPILLEPGPSGKTVKTGLHVFVWKAPITEFRLPVTIAPKRSENLAFVSDGKIAFSSGAMTFTPGKKAGGSFTAALGAFYSGRAQASVKRIDDQFLKASEPPNGLITKTAMKEFTMSSQSFKQGQQKARNLMKKKTGDYLAQAIARENL